MKIYASRHVGFRMEVRDFVARYSATHEFFTFDGGIPTGPGTNIGLMCAFFGSPSFCANVPQVPNTGTFEQRNWFNHLHVTGGVFVRW